MTAPNILAAIAAQPGLDPAFKRAIAPVEVEPAAEVEYDDEPPYDDEPHYDDDPMPLRDDAYADRAAANWWAGRTR